MTIPKCLKYQLEDKCDIKISDYCCRELKKKPIHKWEKENNRFVAITGMRKEEGGTRQLIKGCVLTDKNGKIKKFHPLLVVDDNWEEWIAANHNEQEQEIKHILNTLKANYIIPCLNFDAFLEDNSITRIKMLKGIYNDFQKLLDFNSFTCECWNNKKRELLNEWDFIKKVIENNLFDKVAPRHMYEKKITRYEMTEQYKRDDFWGKRYLQSF